MAHAVVQASTVRRPTPVNGGRRHPAEQLVHALFAGLGRLHTILDQLYGPAGINEHKYLVLTALVARTPASLRPSELARHARVTRSSMTQVLDDLEYRGWVERRRDPSDRRVIRVSLTATGGAVARAAEQHFQTVCDELLREMTSRDLSHFAHLCAAMDRATRMLGKRAAAFEPPASARHEESLRSTTEPLGALPRQE